MVAQVAREPVWPRGEMGTLWICNPGTSRFDSGHGLQSRAARTTCIFDSAWATRLYCRASPLVSIESLHFYSHPARTRQVYRRCDFSNFGSVHQVRRSAYVCLGDNRVSKKLLSRERALSGRGSGSASRRARDGGSRVIRESSCKLMGAIVHYLTTDGNSCPASEGLPGKIA